MYRFIILLLVLLASACRTEKVDPDMLNSGYDLYPLETGHYVDYEVELIQYSGINSSDTVNYFLKELVADSYESGGETWYRLERFYKDSLHHSWPVSPDSVWSSTKNPRYVIRNENNRKIVPLVFPAEEGTIWDGNVWNIAEEDAYTYLTVNERAKVLRQADTSNFVFRDYRSELYEEGAGLVEKIEEQLKYDDQQLGQFIIKSGKKYIQKMIGHGKI